MESPNTSHAVSNEGQHVTVRQPQLAKNHKLPASLMYILMVLTNLHFSSFQRDDHLVIGNKVRLGTVKCDLHFFLYTWVAKPCYPVMSITKYQRYVKSICPDKTADNHTYAEGRLLSRSSGNWEKLHMVEHSGSDTAMNSQQTPPHHLKIFDMWSKEQQHQAPTIQNTSS